MKANPLITSGFAMLVKAKSRIQAGVDHNIKENVSDDVEINKLHQDIEFRNSEIIRANNGILKINEILGK
jgi:hypothetical protein